MFSVSSHDKVVCFVSHCATIEDSWLRSQIVTRLRKAGCRPVVWGVKVTFGTKEKHGKDYDVLSSMLTDSEHLQSEIIIDCLSIVQRHFDLQSQFGMNY